ncbi:MAG: transglycosylase domain-containing protein [Spirochaetes bacterium]|nr:transglycosylase domain-containing protein [Spirochaetota bacterium]
MRVWVEYTRFRLSFEYGYLRRTAVTGVVFFGGFMALLVASFLVGSPSLGRARSWIPQHAYVARGKAPPRVERRVARRWDAAFVRSRSLAWSTVGAFVVTEDSLFYQHRGLDWAEMRSALHDWILGGQSLRGASTITQQLVKNAWLYRNRTPLRKVRELIIARRLENVLSKEEIMDYYLNLVEFGPNLYGIRAASRAYFGVEPQALSVDQAALLTWFLPAPTTRGPAWRRGVPDARRDQHIRWALWQMRAQGYWQAPVPAAAPDEKPPGMEGAPPEE